MNSLTIDVLIRWILRFSELLDEHTGTLTRLDSAIGDADHGINMERGAIAMRGALLDAEFASPSTLFHAVGDALLEGIGGAAGPLYASFFFGAARATLGQDSLDLLQFAASLEAGIAELAARGRAEPGDKTMLDSGGPASHAISAAARRGESTFDAFDAGRQAASRGRDATEALQALKGRASYLGPRSVGHIDPGAASMALLFDALAAGWVEET
jgi:phosphoenolpyruvate---glycerone phosphotransferase subunit DhaL